MYATKYFTIIMRVCLVLLLYFTQCDARKSTGQPRSLSLSQHIVKPTEKLNKISDHLVHTSSDSSSDVSSPFSLPPFDSHPPVSLPEISPPSCINPPSPPDTFPSPTGNIPIPPDTFPNPTGNIPTPPDTFPNPTGNIPTPPDTFPIPTGNTPPYTFPTPTGYVPIPPDTLPTPTGDIPNPPETFPSPSFTFPGSPDFGPTPITPGPLGPPLSPPDYEPSPPSPPVFEPPPNRTPGPGMALWCVAKPSVPDPIIQEAMNYACGSGADCESIQPSGSCFQPDTLYAHASYAFNSYWQRTKIAGGTCDFGGTAILVTVDPSYDGCQFM